MGASSSAAWSVPVSALISAAVALAVVWLAHYLTQLREARRSRDTLLREKLERMLLLTEQLRVARAAEGLHVAAMGIAMSTGSGSPVSVETGSSVLLAEVQMLQFLYFPALAPIIQQLASAYTDHLDFLHRELEFIQLDAYAWSTSRKDTFSQRNADSMLALGRANYALKVEARRIVEGLLRP